MFPFDLYIPFLACYFKVMLKNVEDFKNLRVLIQNSTIAVGHGTVPRPLHIPVLPRAAIDC
jgi:hypothetical protein